MVHSISLHKIIGSLFSLIGVMMLLIYSEMYRQNQRLLSEEWWISNYLLGFGVLTMVLSLFLFLKSNWTKAVSSLVFLSSTFWLLATFYTPFIDVFTDNNSNKLMVFTIIIALFFSHYSLWNIARHPKILAFTEDTANIEQSIGKSFGLILIGLVTTILLSFIVDIIQRISYINGFDFSSFERFILPMALIIIAGIIAFGFYFLKNWARWIVILLVLLIIGTVALTSVNEMRYLKNELMLMLALGLFSFGLPIIILLLLTNKTLVSEYTDLKEENSELLDDFLHEI